MSWRHDKWSLAKWALSGLIGITVGLLCYEANGLAASESATQDKVDTLKARVDKAEGKGEINEQLLREVRDDVKDILRRLR